LEKRRGTDPGRSERRPGRGEPDQAKRQRKSRQNECFYSIQLHCQPLRSSPYHAPPSIGPLAPSRDIDVGQCCGWRVGIRADQLAAPVVIESQYTRAILGPWMTSGTASSSSQPGCFPQCCWAWPCSGGRPPERCLSNCEPFRLARRNPVCLVRWTCLFGIVRACLQSPRDRCAG